MTAIVALLPKTRHRSSIGRMCTSRWHRTKAARWTHSSSCQRARSTQAKAQTLTISWSSPIK